MRALRGHAGQDAEYVHFGATTQDALDSASMLVARGACALIDDELAASRARARD